MQLIALLIIDAGLYVLWSYLFFRLESPKFALFEVAFLWLSILAMIVVIARYSRPAARLARPVWCG